MILHWKISPYFYGVPPNIRKVKIRNHPFMRGVGSFKKYVCSKLPVFEPPPPLFVPVSFTLSPPSPSPPPSRQTYCLNEPFVFLYNTWFIYNVDISSNFTNLPPFLKIFGKALTHLKKWRMSLKMILTFYNIKCLFTFQRAFYGIQEWKQSMFYKCRTCLGYLTK